MFRLVLGTVAASRIAIVAAGACLDGCPPLPTNLIGGHRRPGGDPAGAGDPGVDWGCPRPTSSSRAIYNHYVRLYTFEKLCDWSQHSTHGHMGTLKRPGITQVGYFLYYS
ncbi:hypothetical protein FN846DRAFT_894825 [Sphaerosporella brunnea]|uniref:Secreted protein n=1 Tax=Sphaerosporella brunnea TaxID=1250544 RepID=A0A5J5EI92_9PEZI|nr:hypothetical protein FN846DRAFT_894825 [Sphaerosporella brunnea]